MSERIRRYSWEQLDDTEPAEHEAVACWNDAFEALTDVFELLNTEMATEEARDSYLEPAAPDWLETFNEMLKDELPAEEHYKIDAASNVILRQMKKPRSDQG